MASEYGYAEILDVENVSGIDYSALVGGEITDTVLEANISQAERLVNTYLNTTFTGTIPDAVKYVVIKITIRMLRNKMIEDGIMDRENPEAKTKPLWDESWETLLKPFVVAQGVKRTMYIKT